jgi:magnesium and cobalt exporter, CNNM family
MMWLLAVLALALIIFGGVMAASETAIMAQSRVRIVDAAKVSRFRRSFTAIATDSDAHVNAVSFMRIGCEITATVLVAITLWDAFGEPWAALVITAVVMTLVSFLLVGVGPRSLGRAHARTVLAVTAPLIHSVRVFFGPVPHALVALGNWATTGRAGVRFTSEEQLLSMVDQATELEVLEEDDRELIHSVFEFSDTVVRELMIPRTDMVTVSSRSRLADGMKVFLRAGVSRMPVVGDEVDEIKGILYLRDVARMTFERPIGAEEITVEELARPALFVPESKKADELLRHMQLESNHLAMVVDEYGGIAGLVTMEDLIEELVGEIADEYDREVAQVEQLGEDHYRVSARLPVDELGELFGLELEDEDVDSVGGLLAKALGRLPVPGSTAHVGGLTLKAERAERRRKRIATVLVEIHEAAAEDETAGSKDGLDRHGTG